MFDIDLNCAKLNEHKRLEQQVAYYNGNIAKQRKTTRKIKHGNGNFKQRGILLH